MTGSEQRPWLDAEVALFLSMIEENRSIGEMEFALSRTEHDLEAKAVDLQRDLPREFETSFFLHVRNARERRKKNRPSDPL